MRFPSPRQSTILLLLIITLLSLLTVARQTVGPGSHGEESPAAAAKPRVKANRTLAL